MSDPAFPVAYPRKEWKLQRGLSKREYYAAIAMQGLMTQRHSHSPEEVAKIAVIAADALITALEKKA